VEYVAAVVVQLVSREGCHLCQEAEESLSDLGVAFERLDVDADPELERLYDFRVPVLLLDGSVAAEGRLGRSELIRALAR
jgi:glutaredoxin